MSVTLPHGFIDRIAALESAPAATPPASLAAGGARSTSRCPAPAPSAGELQQRSEAMRAAAAEQRMQPAYVKMASARASLPAMVAQRAVLDAVATHDVTVIGGGTGCGKSTQVPQCIFDEWIDGGRGAEVNIVIAQPRRIAAVGLAERVAAERAETAGGSVGYSIRLDSKRSATQTRLLFCTTGVLLRMLQSDAGLATSGARGGRVTHVVVDEVHERSCDADLLLLALRELLEGGAAQAPKVVLMSATLDAAQLGSYFAAVGARVGSLEIAGRTFPVERKFLADAIDASGYRCAVGARSPFARRDLTLADIRRQHDGGSATGRGAPTTAPAERAPAPATATEELIAKNLAARAKKAAAQQGSSAKGVGVVGGRTQVRRSFFCLPHLFLFAHVDSFVDPRRRGSTRSAPSVWRASTRASRRARARLSTRCARWTTRSCTATPI